MPSSGMSGSPIISMAGEAIAYEYGLKDELDGASASPDLELVRERGGPR